MDKEETITWMVVQKFRFDIAASFMVFLNFFLLIVAASNNIQEYLSALGLNVGIKIIMSVGVVIAISNIWIFGFVLDSRLKYFQRLEEIRSRRNPILMKILENTKKG